VDDEPARVQLHSSKNKPYCPGQVISKSVLSTAQPSAMHVSAQNFIPECNAVDAEDQERDSDCSTTDTMPETYLPPSDAGMMMSSPMVMAAGALWPPSAYHMPLWPQQAAMPINPGMLDMPTMGSKGHRFGRCKPCAFLHKEGCRSGANCKYCHLCPPGERERRKRVMRAMCNNVRPRAESY